MIDNATWRKSSFSGGGGNGGADCVEIAHLVDGTVAIRDSKSPAHGMIRFGATEMAACFAAIRAENLDHGNRLA
ncbi:DUF397 domain-containing protein [Actinokineospora enzanensis]|uniref:DUF397 domain-containing protein n=1 Tax=Actinokineospora enzanensis TaxID=155975 RepID=UPI000381C3A0|nr:DUF397 domain-containing protein [Actinokineospora enzanensis]